MLEQSTHTLELVQTYTSGAQEWHCPTCGRRMIMQWRPKYKKIVLEPGDEQISHAGGTSEPQHAEHADDTTPDDGPNHEALGPWLKWLRDADTDSAN